MCLLAGAVFTGLYARANVSAGAAIINIGIRVYKNTVAFYIALHREDVPKKNRIGIADGNCRARQRQ